MAKPRIKVFIDSNVIISGLLSDRAAPRLILDLLCHELPFIQAATGRYNLDEIQRTLTRKLPAAAPVFRDFMTRLKLEIVPQPERKMLENYSGLIVDEDLPVLVSAMAWEADYLVTGDKKHFGGLKGKMGIPLKVCSPSEFVEILAASIKRLL